MVACTEENITVAFLDWGDEETIFDSQKVEPTFPSEILIDLK